MDLEAELKKIGLNKSELKVYMHLLANGLSSPPQIAAATGIARTNIYHLIDDLLERGLIEEQLKRKRKIYLARDPEAILRSIERQKEAVERLLPELRALYKVQKNQPVIRFYDGVDELMEIFDQTLQAKQILGIASTEQLFGLSSNYFAKKYPLEIKKREISFRDILTYESGKDAAKRTKVAMGGLYEYRLLKSDFGNPACDILIWDDKIALMTLNEPVFGTVLTSKTLADMFRVMFEIMWRSASVHQL